MQAEDRPKRGATMYIEERWEEQLKRVIEARAEESVFADPAKFPRRMKAPRTQFPSSADQPRKRGVYELEFAPPGRRAFHMVASNGDVGYVDFPVHWANRDLIKNLWRRLDREDPPRADLRVIRASE